MIGPLWKFEVGDHVMVDNFYSELRLRLGHSDASGPVVARKLSCFGRPYYQANTGRWWPEHKLVRVYRV